jgi:hypothetical protein
MVHNQPAYGVVNVKCFTTLALEFAVELVRSVSCGYLQFMFPCTPLCLNISEWQPSGLSNLTTT